METRRAPAPYRRQQTEAGALRLDANEGCPPPLANQCWPPDPELLRRYPDPSNLESELAERLGVNPDQVLVTAGADDAIDRACRRWLRPGRDMVLTRPTFTMFHRYAQLAGAGTNSVPWWEGPYPVAQVAALAGENTGLMVVVSPNNPTGAVIGADELARLRAMRPEPVLLVDAAYGEFAGTDLTPKALALPRTLVLRTFSKAWGLAGLRVGYVVGPADLVAELRAWGQPYAVAGNSLDLVAQALQWPESGRQEALEIIREHRTQLGSCLERLGVPYLSSQGNFLLCRPAHRKLLVRGLAALGVVVRSWPDDPELAAWVRITVPGSPAEMTALQDALETVLQPEALLFDMDGVLADVSGSYRACMRQIMREENVDLAPSEIDDAKDRGKASNDWELTRRLLAERGIKRSLAEITRRFQELYLGHGDQPGLASREHPLVSREWLLDLARRHPLAVVTGRPRDEAAAFLERFGLTPAFTAVICHEDAPAKPDPAPVRLALERLGVSRAWMLGDTPDDVFAARGAGVLPLGVCPEGASRPGTRQALLAAGAVMVLDSSQQIQEVLA